MNDHHHHHENCLALFDKLSEYLDREADEETCRQIEEHLKDCQPCVVCLETLKRTMAICKEQKEKPVPADISRKIRFMLDELRP